jgi:hypothetical protein
MVDRPLLCRHEPWESRDALMHAGRVVAFGIRPEGGLVRLGASDELGAGAKVNTLQVECDCGWRSRRYVAPDECSWANGTLTLPVAIDGAARALWQRHCVEERGAFLTAVVEPETEAPGA